MKRQFQPLTLELIKTKLQDKLELRYTEGKGYGLYAKQKIRLGSLLYEETALACVLADKEIRNRCSNCMRISEDPYNLKQLINPTNVQNEQLLQCSACKYVVYCSKSCQLEDWKKSHSKECIKFRQLKELPSQSVRLINKIINLSSDDKASFFELIYHDLNLQHKQQYATLSLASQPLLNIKKEFKDSIEFLNAWSRMKFNIFTMSDEEQANIGLGFYFISALINHACLSNCEIAFFKDKIAVKAIKEIDINEEITFAYVDNLLPLQVRQNELKEGFYFECGCELCMKQNDNKDIDPLELVYCSNCKKSNRINQIMSKSSEVNCSSCFTELKPNPETIMKYKNKLDDNNNLIDDKELNQIEDAFQYLDKHHYIKVKLKYFKIFFELNKMKEFFNDNRDISKQEHKVIDCIKDHLKDIGLKYSTKKTCLLVMLAKLYFEKENTDRSLVMETANLALKNLKVTHHPDSNLIKLLSFYIDRLNYQN